MATKICGNCGSTRIFWLPVASPACIDCAALQPLQWNDVSDVAFMKRCREKAAEIFGLGPKVTPECFPYGVPPKKVEPDPENVPKRPLLIVPDGLERH